jgi:RNA polymerase sigma factor (sigma-70 family)
LPDLLRDATLHLVTTSSGATLRETTGDQLPHRPAFVTTHWSVVLMAGRTDTPRAQAALENLCQTYWYPLYAYVRRCGHSPEDAQDLTQGFFARLLERQWLARADQSKGRFRTFLLTALERFLANEWDKAHALKRGGDRQLLPVQFETAETRYGIEPIDERTPEHAFEYRWAVALLDEVLQQLQADFESQGETELFAALKPCLIGDSASQPYAQLAVQLGMTESAVKVAVHRVRHRYRELLRAEVANTVISPVDVDAEMRHLFNVLARR